MILVAGPASSSREPLAPADRLVIALLELEERSVREIASLTSWTPINARARVDRARRALKPLLEAHHER